MSDYTRQERIQAALAIFGLVDESARGFLHHMVSELINEYSTVPSDEIRNRIQMETVAQCHAAAKAGITWNGEKETERDVFFGEVRVGERVGTNPQKPGDDPRYGQLVEIVIHAGYCWVRIQFDGHERPHMVDPEVVWPEEKLKWKLESAAKGK